MQGKFYICYMYTKNITAAGHVSGSMMEWMVRLVCLNERTSGMAVYDEECDTI